MGDKEATPVEDVEVLLPPEELKQLALTDIQPEVPTPTAVSYTHLDVYKRQKLINKQNIFCDIMYFNYMHRK